MTEQITKKYFISKYPVKHDEIHIINEYIDNLLVNKQLINNLLVNEKNISTFTIKKGTVLYHGSLDPNMQFTRNTITFFSIDKNISIWYLLEMSLLKMSFINRLLYNKHEIGYLYKYEILYDIDIQLVRDINENAKNGMGLYNFIYNTTGYEIDALNFSKYKNVITLHPQIILRGIEKQDKYELSSEITIPIYMYPNLLKLLNVSEININYLYENKNNFEMIF